MKAALRHLTIKPFHYCSHNCPYCDSRQELFQESSEASLGLEDWARVFAEADDLGCEYLDISGGEPTLYKALPALIWEAKRRGWYVSINSTGMRVPELLSALEAVCLDQIIISMISLDAACHDAVRRTSGSWNLARKALEVLRGSSLRLIIHLIVCRHNFRELPDWIDFAFNVGANGLALVYPENDQDAHHLLLSDDQIRSFQREILPECLRRYEAYYPSAERSHSNLAALYEGHGVGGDFSRGLYWNDPDTIRSLCDKPTSFALIYANGNVLPCNAVEYTHAPMVGNVIADSLIDLWHGPAWERFRQERMRFCQWCPIKRHTGIAIRTRDNPPYAAPVVRHVPERLPQNRPDAPAPLLRTRVSPRTSELVLPVIGLP
jgi:MoaA/NifB/PqqE/SkfB family radical SAM enzyme